MSTEANTEKIDVKVLLGNPKITFVLGGPASGKGTQCAKLVEEFGYTHISTGDLMRQEMKKGSREGDRIRKIVSDGGLVPFELTVQVLINALIANPSQNYLIDGFPRALDQALHFEQNVCTAQNVLFFNVDEETCLQRCLKRAETSDRSDDKASILQKRLQAYNEQTKPVIELYQKFQKVREIDGNRDPGQVYEDTRKAMLPQVFFMVGPQASGKTTLGNQLSKRTNMKLLNFSDFVAKKGLKDADDETVTTALIHRLTQEISPRVLLEDFPQTEFQARFFIKNCTEPSRVFVLNCPKDICQQRMISLGQDHPNYQPSTLLSQKIRLYNERSEKLIPFLQANTNTKIIDTDQPESKAFAQMAGHVQPVIIHIRSSGSQYAQDLLKKTSTELVQNHGFCDLNSNEIIRLETERRTEFGREIQKIHNAGKLIDEKVIVRMLRNIIYSGQAGRDKFLISGFPGSPEQVQEFENTCANITAIVYTTQTKEEIHPTVEVMNNSLVSMNIDALFQKQFRLKTMKEWDFAVFEEHLGQKVDWGVVTGRTGSGKTTVANQIAGLTRGKVIDMNAISEAVKGRLGSEDDPFEGDVPVDEVEKDVIAIIKADQDNQQRFTYIFDGFFHKEPADFFAWLQEKFGFAKFWVPLQCKQEAIEDRYKAKEEGNEVTEELQEEFAEQGKDAEEQSRKIREVVEEAHGKTETIGDVETDGSLETTIGKLRNQFSAKVVIVNHEQRLSVDTACCNLAIKYNMLYLSVYQLIRQHIEDCTPQGKAILASKKPKSFSKDSSIKDEFQEQEYSPVHFDLHLVTDLIRDTIAEKRTSQKYILLEGMCNSNKLADEEDQLALRFMDEFFLIEKNIGEVCGVIGLQFNAESTQFIEDKFEEFPEPVVEEPKPKAEGDEDEEEAPAEEEDEEEKKVPSFKPEDYKWTVTNGRPKNLPQLFRDYKGINCHCEEKDSNQFNSSYIEAIPKALDEFCQRIREESANRSIYQQVIFNE